MSKKEKHTVSQDGTTATFDSLPFGSFIMHLKSDGFLVDMKDFTEFARVFESFSDDTRLFSDSIPDEENKDPRRKLKYYLAPLICRNESEQKKFYQSFDNYFITKKGGVVSTEPVVAPKIRWWQNPFFYVILTIIVFASFIGYVIQPAPVEKIENSKPDVISIDLKTSSDSLWTKHPIRFGYKSNDSILSNSKNLKSTWTFSDNSTTSTGAEVQHSFENCGEYRVELSLSDSSGQTIASDYQVFNVTPSLQLLNYNGTDFFIGDTVIIIASSVDSFYSENALSWNVFNATTNDAITPHPDDHSLRFVYVPKDTGSYQVTLSGSGCSPNATASFNVFSRDNFQLVSAPTHDPIEQQFSFSPFWMWGFILVSLIGVSLTVYFYNKKKRTGKILPVIPEDEFSGMEGPMEVPFLSKNGKIVKLQKQSAFSSLLLQRTESDITYLNVPKTLKSTIQNLGFLVPEYARRQKDKDYLVLIDKTNSAGGQYANLFTYLVKNFVTDNVNLSFYFFEGKTDRIYRQNSKQYEKLSTLKDKHYGSNLLIFGNGYSFLSPAYPDISVHVKEEFSYWTKKVIITPVAAKDWSSKERILTNQFNIVPADIEGLLELIKFINEDLPGNSSLKKEDWKTYQAKNINAGDIESLRAYINDPDVFRWLCATSVYHLIRWEVLIEIGKNILAKQAAAGKLNYVNLLRIARIKWVEEGSFPPSLRLAMLKELTVEDEIIARRTMLNLMSESDKLIDANSFSYEEKMTQRYTDSFVLYAHDHLKNESYKEDAEKFMGLWRNNEIADMTLHIYLDNPDRQWETPVNAFQGSDKNISTSAFIDQVVRPKKPFDAYTSTVATIIVIVLFLAGKLLDKDFYQSRFNAWTNIVTTQYPNSYDISVLLDNNSCKNLFVDSTTNPQLYLAENVNASLKILDSAAISLNAQTDSFARFDSLFRNIKLRSLKNRQLYFMVRNGKSSLVLPVSKDSLYKTYHLAIRGMTCELPDSILLTMSYDSSVEKSFIPFFTRLVAAQNFLVRSTEVAKKEISSTVFYYDPSEKTRAMQLASMASQSLGRSVTTSLNQKSGRKKNEMELWVGPVPCIDIQSSSISGLVQGTWYFNDNFRTGFMINNDSLRIYRFTGKSPAYVYYRITGVKQCGEIFTLDLESGSGRRPSTGSLVFIQTNADRLTIQSGLNSIGNYQLLFDVGNFTELNDADPIDLGFWTPSEVDSAQILIQKKTIVTVTYANKARAALEYDTLLIKSFFRDRFNNRIYTIADPSTPNELETAIILIDRKGNRYYNVFDLYKTTFDRKLQNFKSLKFDGDDFYKLKRNNGPMVTKQPQLPSSKNILWIGFATTSITDSLYNLGFTTKTVSTNVNLMLDLKKDFDFIITDSRGPDDFLNQKNVQMNTSPIDGLIHFIKDLRQDLVSKVIVFEMGTDLSKYEKELRALGIRYIVSTPDELYKIIRGAPKAK